MGEMAALRRSRCDLLRSRLHVAESLADVDGSPRPHRGLEVVELPERLVESRPDLHRSGGRGV